MLAAIMFLIFAYLFPVLASWLIIAYIGWWVLYIAYKIIALLVSAFNAPADQPTSYELELQRADRIVRYGR